jgi:hypothetical protein
MQVTQHEYELNFMGGPAEGQVIRMFLELTKRRWFCRRLRYTWWSICEPLEDAHTEAFEYKIVGHAPRPEGALVIYKLVKGHTDVGKG